MKTTIASFLHFIGLCKFHAIAKAMAIVASGFACSSAAPQSELTDTPDNHRTFDNRIVGTAWQRADIVEGKKRNMGVIGFGAGGFLYLSRDGKNWRQSGNYKVLSPGRASYGSRKFEVEFDQDLTRFAGESQTQPVSVEATFLGRHDFLGEIKAKAESGDPLAQFNLGRIYDTGRGVSRDEKEAASWYLKAAEQGSPEALKALKAMQLRRQAAAKFDREITSIVRVEYKGKYHPVVGARGLRPEIQVEGKRRAVQRAKFNFAPKGGVDFKEGYIEIEDWQMSGQSLDGAINREFHFQARMRPSADLENCFVAIALTPEIGDGGILFHEIPDLKAGKWKFVRFVVSTTLPGGGRADTHYFSNGLEVFPKPRFERMQSRMARQGQAQRRR